MYTLAYQWADRQTHRHRWVQDTPTHSHQRQIPPPRRAGKGKESLFFFFLVFVIETDFEHEVLRAT